MDGMMRWANEYDMKCDGKGRSTLDQSNPSPTTRYWDHVPFAGVLPDVDEGREGRGLVRGERHGQRLVPLHLHRSDDWVIG